MRLAVLSLLGLAVFAPGAGAEPASVRVTTDSYEYCTALARRLSVMPQAEREPIRSLRADGLRLCDDGYVRTGVARLRRALRAAQEAALPPEH
jgi:hypothetical protein